MKNTTLFKITFVGAALVAVGVGTYALLSRLSEQTLGLLAGAAAVLTVVVIVGLLFLVNNALQARLLHRQATQENFDDLKQIALLTRLLGSGRAPNVNVKVPEQSPLPPTLSRGQAPSVVGGQVWPFFLPGAGQAQLPEPNQPWGYDGAYRDTTFDGDVELE